MAGPYTPPIIVTNISNIVQDRVTADEAIRTQERGSVAPTDLLDGLLWQSTHLSTNNAATLGAGAFLGAYSPQQLLLRRTVVPDWAVVLDLAYPQINAGGTIAMGADFDMGNNSIVNVDNVMVLDAGNWDAAGLQVKDAADPTDAQDLATKAYVDGAGGGGGGGMQLAFFQNGNPNRIYHDGASANQMVTSFKPEGIILIAKGQLHDMSAGSPTATDRGNIRQYRMIMAGRPSNSHVLEMPGLLHPFDFLNQDFATSPVGDQIATAGGGVIRWESGSQNPVGGSNDYYTIVVEFQRDTPPYGVSLQFRKNGSGASIGIFDDISGQPAESSLLQAWIFGGLTT